METINPKTGMTHTEVGTSVRDHFETWRERFPDLHVWIEDMIAEDDGVVVRTVDGDRPAPRKKMGFRRIVIWRIANPRILERWARVEAPQPA